MAASSTDFYTVEARKFSGYDVRLPAEAVVLHRVNTTRSAQEGHARVVDPDLNGDPNDQGARWLPGETYTDAPNGISVDVLESTANTYLVGVTLKTTALSVSSISNAARSKTITCTNSTATAPFGAIDTPAQGATVSGNVVNFGWVLSPAPRRADPPGGGTVQLVIDGAILAQVPSGWTSRSDLTALFPLAQFSGVDSALGVASIDTTPLTNGVHTISWLVTDNMGAASGVGSRYFTVSNGSGQTLDPAFFRLTAFAAAAAVKKAEAPGVDGRDPVGLLKEIPWPPPLGGRLTGRRRFDVTAPSRTYEPDAAGRITIQAEELDRIELVLEGVEGGRRVEGALRVGRGLAPLPIGSRIDPAAGTFTWHPGVGFVGVYDLVLDGRDVRIVLNPKGSGRVGPQTVIDLATGPIVAGWAADLDSAVDTGVDTVHVWAYPLRGGDPIWVGAAEYGGARPDVAAVFGERFRKSGYGLTVRGLSPGTYDLAVSAYSTVRGGFVPAKVARVTVR